MSHVNTAAAKIFFLATNLLQNAYRIDFVFQDVRHSWTSVHIHATYVCVIIGCLFYSFYLMVMAHSTKDCATSQ